MAALPDAGATGRLQGTVTRAAGARGGTIVVSASGPAGTAVATCDAAGRFEFPDLPAGVYLLRAHLSGTAAAGRAVVAVKPGLSTFQTLNLESSGAFAGERTVLAAGIGDGLDQDLIPGLDEAVEAPPGEAAPAAARSADDAPAHGHAEKLWRLRRARRSVLKDLASMLRPGGAGE
ncbi:MAG: carboxypeptidase regulatory-like domain-containing protein [Acidobacteria bacterium]|nr:carboxypeptidase regulatory-like domain-containing protein [Acidobacteriota bacterium]